ncbi:zinc finger protein 518A isoform X2 [Amia ocellicauda]|uniref:zinc finger protein 518A isoform X2 n=1 Tax=Amia ocellicauda TaxID=2972642 RepID=UPI003464A54C
MEPGQNMPDDPPESSENGKPTEQESEASRPQPSAFPTPAQSLELGLKDFKVMLPVMPNLQQYALQKTGTIPAEPKVQTARKSFKRKPIKGQDTEGPSPHPRLNLNPREGVKVSGKILRFSCSECKGDTAFSPNDLMKHFQVAHQGFLPTYPCDMCNFTANDFSLLQQHRLRHRDTFVKCEICNDSIQYTLLQLTRHFGLYHSLNGNYRCEKCKFCTKDVGTFVQHIHRHGEVQYKCGKCPHVSFTKGEFQRHLVMHTGSFPFICQFCDYGATRKDYIIKHMSAMHSDEIERKCKWKEKDDGAKTLVDMSPGLKLLLKKNVAGVPRDAHWRTKGLHALSGGGLLDEYGRLSNPEKTLEETQQFLERSVVSEKDSAQWAKVRKNEQQYISPILPAVLHPMLESGFNSNTGLIKTGSNGSPMLMVKNKISIPPNCTTKFMGFKMVDGKKHLVLKVIPAAKLGTPQNVPSTVGKDTNGHLPEIHPEDINGANSDVASQSSSQSEPSNCAESGQSTLPGGSDLHQSGAESPAVKQSDEAEDLPSHATPHTADEEVESAVRQMNDDDEIPGVSVSPASSKVFHSSDQTMHRAPSPCEETGQPKEQTVSPDGTSLDTEKVTLTSEETELLRGEPADPVKESDDRLILNSSREEVFSFHNYSKDRTSDQSSDSLPSSEGGELCDTHNSESVQGVEDLPSGNVTPVEQLPPESQERRTEDETGDATTDQLSGHSDQSAMEKIPDSEIEVDECVAAVEEDAIWPPEAMDENADSTEMPKITSVFSLQSPKNSPKLGVSQLPDNGLETGSKASPVSEAPACPKNTEEVNQPAGEIGSPCRAAALGRILEEHSDAIISHQLEKERFGTANQDPAKHTATLRIIQPVGLTEGGKTPGPSQDCSINSLRVSQVLKHTSPTSVQGKAQEWEAGRGVSNTDKSKPASPARAGQDLAVIKRKRQRKRSQGDSSDSPSKAKRPPSKKAKEKQKGEAETPESFRGVEPKDVERTLRLSPFSRAQLIKCPRRNQPVVVLNHPDADLPEVANVMKTINKFKGHVLKVALSQRTVDALSESDAGPCKTTPAAISHASRKRRLKPPSPVKERYILKLRLKKMSRNKYKVVNSTSDRMERSSFSCWFCGRIFDNQEEWIGHGQRHLMEATRDWDTLF